MYKYLALLLLILPEMSSACSIHCPKLDWQYRSAEYLFIGKVTKVEEHGISADSEGMNVKVYFDISKNWKGDWGDRPLKTINRADGYCGGYLFKEGQTRIMFISRYERVNTCDSQLVSSKEIESFYTPEIDEIHNIRSSPYRAAQTNVIQQLKDLVGESERYVAFFWEIKSAFKAMDRNEIARLVSYPLHAGINPSRKRIYNEEDFLNSFDQIITPRVIAAVNKQEFHDLYVDEMRFGVSVIFGSGEIFFRGSCGRYDHGCKDNVFNIICIDC